MKVVMTLEMTNIQNYVAGLIENITISQSPTEVGVRAGGELDHNKSTYVNVGC